jgi:hypothetical protein
MGEISEEIHRPIIMDLRNDIEEMARILNFGLNKLFPLSENNAFHSLLIHNKDSGIGVERMILSASTYCAV